MAVFQSTVPTDVGPVRSTRLYYIAWASEWRALYVHAGGSPQALATLRAKGSGQYVYNADEFRYVGTFRWLETRAAPHNLYSTGKKLRALGLNIGAKDKAYGTVWQFAPDAPLDQRPNGGVIKVGYPWNKITYRYDRTTNTYLRSVTGESKQTDAATGSQRPQERDRHADAVRAAHHGQSCQAPARGDDRRQRPGRDSRPTAGRARARGRRQGSPSRPSSTTPAAKRSS